MEHKRIALIRGINVGTAKRVAMADLRTLLTELGYGNPTSLLNSGNLVFTAGPEPPAELERRLESGFSARFGFSAKFTVLTPADLQEILTANVLRQAEADPSRFLVAVLNRPEAIARVSPHLEADWHPDVVAQGRRAIYLWCAGGILESRFATVMNKALGEAATTRNWATLQKLSALVHREPAPPAAARQRTPLSSK